MMVNAVKWTLRKAVRASMVGLERGPHITRYAMYGRLSQVVPPRPLTGTVLSISRSLPLCKLLGLGDLEIAEANYPECNILSLPFPDNHFDYVVSDQVLEHVEGDPQTAMDESYRILKPGGLAIHTTCFINPVHCAPSDLWRFSPEGLRHLSRSFGEIIDCSGWGNPYIWLYIWAGLRIDGVPLARWHPVHRLATMNDALWPVVTWVVARK